MTKVLLRSMFVLIISMRTAYGFGIDKLYGELDAAKSFRSVATFRIFNDSQNERIFVTARQMKWDMDGNGTYLLETSDDLKISPQIQQIAAGDSATFKVQYLGSDPIAEKAYRVYFTEILLPSDRREESRAPEAFAVDSVTSDMRAGISVSVPIYVSDLSKKDENQEHVKAHLLASCRHRDDYASVEVNNSSKRRVTVLDYKIGSFESKGLGVVLDGHIRVFQLPCKGGDGDIWMNISDGDSTKRIVLKSR